MAIRHLFVYGSLRRSLCPLPLQPIMRRGCVYLGMAWTPGRLYEVGGYPGLVAHPDGKVYGELYGLLLPRRVLAALDRYEECAPDFAKPHEYTRQQHTVFGVDNGVGVLAWLYLYNRAVTGLRLLTSGDYCQA